MPVEKQQQDQTIHGPGDDGPAFREEASEPCGESDGEFDEESDKESEGQRTVLFTIRYRDEEWNFDFRETDTVAHLFDELECTFLISASNMKLLLPRGVLPKPHRGMIKPSTDPSTPLAPLHGKTLKLLASEDREVEDVNYMAQRVADRAAARTSRARRPWISTETHQMMALDAKYTFYVVRPLEGLPNPRRSELVLLRLREDPGIKAVMKKHKFKVALLTEMEPLAHTEATHEGTSRTLGLNRNKGEVIELRLRTDAHDGYRDYKTIRKTLCHELAHNVHGPHDAAFWSLCHQIEREVEAADWTTSGHTIGESSRYTIQGRDKEAGQDEGGWTGGEFKLGGEFKVSQHEGNIRGLSRRQILAAAAMARRRQQAITEEISGKTAQERQRSRHDDKTE
ncbi:hypothetical protein CDD80_2549 [Ophiocordyceps camponoti-rufipedis]|uniref:WLM domain-containing protein n=1 Tax=Ophiocordyceps camponoti-rufipedis TaxID=2004952 RepID=A0A2C5YQ03_9HYPO|nr:hypothetical protein CDD80_2549 [Ophiocordyceps camponoti-rufipedis]